MAIRGASLIGFSVYLSRGPKVHTGAVGPSGGLKGPRRAQMVTQPSTKMRRRGAITPPNLLVDEISSIVEYIAIGWWCNIKLKMSPSLFW